MVFCYLKGSYIIDRGYYVSFVVGSNYNKELCHSRGKEIRIRKLTKVNHKKEGGNA